MEREKEQITAAGGYVVRMPERSAAAVRNVPDAEIDRDESPSVPRTAQAGEPEVLMIFRRGVWDLPKGKMNSGESLRECALREVGEEVGAHQLKIDVPLGTTTHEYERGGVHFVKTTHWYLMRSSAESFYPQKEEGIEAVSWLAWSDALRRVGYESLRRHMQEITPQVVRQVE